MGDRRKDQAERMARYAHLIEQQTGKAVRPFRADGYVNLLNRYGTQQDTTERYRYQAEPMVPDELLTMYYEGNGLFAKIIDTPAEEAIKHGFHLEGLKDQKVEDFFNEALDELDWEETAMTAIRWARLFGGSIAVMLINDGRGLEEPLDWRNIRSIDDIRVYDRSVIQPEEWSMFSYDPQDPFRTRGSRLGMPERYHVSSRYGSFVVHDSRCLVFQNGILPENTTSSVYQLWGIPEYVRIQRAIRDAEIAHGSATKLLDRSVQAVYKMKDLASELATEEGEDRVLRRLQTIDMARGLLNSITIDSEGEDYDFRQFQFSGVSDVIDSTCNFLSALTSIPQTILFGRSPAGMNATGDADLENWYNALERIQKRMVKKNLRYLLSVVFQAGVRTGEVDEVPKIKITFNPLWSLSDMEQADLEQKRAQTQLTRAQTAQTYIDKQVIDPSEVRKKLADSEEFDVENMLDEYEDEDLFAGMEGQMGGDVPPGENTQRMEPGAALAAQGAEPGAVPAGGPAGIMEQGALAEYGQGVSLEEHNRDPGGEGEAPAAAPAATKLPQDMSDEEKQQAARASQADASDAPTSNTADGPNPSSVGVLVISDGKILTGTRHNDFGYGLICGPGGHVEPGETPTQAAFRETEEEFGISPKSLIPLGRGPKEPETGLEPYLFLCTEYEGEPDCVDLEMTGAAFRTMEELDQLAASMFQPFADGLEILKTCLETALFFGDDGGEMHGELVDSIGRAVNGDSAPVTEDGGPGSGNFGHEGRPGEIGGSIGEVGELAQQCSNPQEYIRKNVKVLKEHGIKTKKAATKAWKDGNYAKDIKPHEVGVEDAVDTIREKVPSNVLTGWFRDADSTYKGRLEELALADDEVRNAGLNIAYQNYRDFAGGGDISFDEFLDTEIPVYRGKNSENWVEGDDVVSFSFDRRIAEKFGATVTEIKIKPRQTIGSYQTTGECEILVRRCDIDALGFQGDSAEASESGNPRKEEIASVKKQIAEGGGFSFSATPNYYRCPDCGETYGRPLGERKNRPIRRCMKCGKVVTMEILPEPINRHAENIQ